MASGYEDQITPADMDFAVEDQGERLRQAFAQIMAMNGQAGAAPMDALMAAQMKSQMPQRPQIPSSPTFGGDAMTLMPQAPEVPGLGFPTAPAGPGSPEAMLPKLPESPKSDGQRFSEYETSRPFGGKGEVIGPYELPKKKKSKKDKD